MPDLATCPDPEKLLQLMQGTVAADDLLAFTGHLDICAKCADRIQKMEISTILHSEQQNSTLDVESTKKIPG